MYVRLYKQDIERLQVGSYIPAGQGETAVQRAIEAEKAGRRLQQMEGGGP